MNLGGSVRNTTVVALGADPVDELPLPVLTDSSHAPVPTFWDPLPPSFFIEGAGVSRTSGTETTAYTDTGMQVDEGDVEAAGRWSVGRIADADHPKVVVTTVKSYGTVQDPGAGLAGDPAAGISTASGDSTDVVTQSQDETETGTAAAIVGGGGAHDDEDYRFDSQWSGAYGSGTARGRLKLQQGDTFSGTDTPTSETVQDGVADTRAFFFREHSDLVAGTPLTGAVARSATHTQDAHRTENSTETDDGGVEALTAAAGSGSNAVVDHAVHTGPAGTLVDFAQSRTAEGIALAPDGSGDVQTEAKTWSSYERGNDPITGAAVDVAYNPQTGPPYVSPNSADWFASASDFAAALADKATCGATAWVRKQLGINDAVDTKSRAYANGEIAGEVLGEVVGNLTPCGQALKIKYAIKALHGAQAAGNAIGAADALSSGDILEGLDKLAAARGSVGQMLKKCFVAGTPMKLADGSSKPIEQIRGYDEYGDDCDVVLTRDEHRPDSPLLARRVLQTFVRQAPVLYVHVRGRAIGTTAEHPFYACGKGWRNADELQFGDRLMTSEGEGIACEGVADGGTYATVYNFEVEDAHTYFVGEESWGFDVWVHNAGPGYTGPRGAGGGRKHNSHGPGSDKSGAGQARQRDKQTKFKKKKDAKTAAHEQAQESLKQLKASAKTEADLKLILGKLTEEQWVIAQAKKILGR